MTEPSPGSPPPKAAVDATDPALALADVWDLLDVLPAAGASSEMVATTIEMAAVTGAGGKAGTGATRSRTSGGQTVGPVERPSAMWWTVSLAVVLASLIIGITVGRATVPNPELGILANLPIAEHIDLLREAGSVGFLEEVAKRDYPAPRRPPRSLSQSDVRADAEEFDAAIQSLRKGVQSLEADGSSRETLAARRDEVLEMSDEERRQLEKSVRAYQRLSAADRLELTALARAISAPRGESLLKAARLWHLWIQYRDPADRRDVIELGTADRLECLDRWTRLDGRNEGRNEGRDNGRPPFDREPDANRRPPPEFRQGPPPEYRQGPPERRNGQPRPPGPLRPRGAGQGQGQGREGQNPDGPPVSGREPSPEETPAPPR